MLRYIGVWLYQSSSSWGSAGGVAPIFASTIFLTDSSPSFGGAFSGLVSCFIPRSNTEISLGRIFARSTPDKRACRSPSGKCEPMRRTSPGLMSVRVNQRQKKEKAGLLSCVRESASSYEVSAGDDEAVIRTLFWKSVIFRVGSRAERVTNAKRTPTRSVLFVLVTRTGIEPMFSAWEADVLTAWPTGLALFSLSIIQPFFHFVKVFLKSFSKKFQFPKIGGIFSDFSLFFTFFVA